MEALVEMLAAILVAILEAMILAVQAMASAVVLVIELVVTWIFRGRAAAEQKYRMRQVTADAPNSAPTANPFSGANLESIPELADRPTVAASGNTIPPRIQLVLGILIVGIASGAVGVTWYQRELTKQRITQTRTQIELLADGFSAQIRLPQPVLPEGKLPERDAWGTPCELFVDEWLFGTLIVVRSWGPDTEHGTLDDLLEIQFTRPPLKIFGRNLAAVGVDLIQRRIQQLLSGKEVPPQNMQIRIRD